MNEAKGRIAAWFARVALGCAVVAALGVVLVPKRIIILPWETRHQWIVIDFQRTCPSAGNRLWQMIRVGSDGYACVGNDEDDWIRLTLCFAGSIARPILTDIRRSSSLDLGYSPSSRCLAHAFTFFWGDVSELRSVRQSPADRLREHHPECRL